LVLGETDTVNNSDKSKAAPPHSRATAAVTTGSNTDQHPESGFTTRIENPGSRTPETSPPEKPRCHTAAKGQSQARKDTSQSASRQRSHTAGGGQ